MTESQPAMQTPIECPIWHSPLYRLVSVYNERTHQWEDAIMVKCRSCRGNVHLETRESLLRKWDALHQDMVEKCGILAEKQGT